LNQKYGKMNRSRIPDLAYLQIFPSWIPDPDPGVKKAPDPKSGSAKLQKASKWYSRKEQPKDPDPLKSGPDALSANTNTKTPKL
jgi:hypothetical protein